MTAAWLTVAAGVWAALASVAGCNREAGGAAGAVAPALVTVQTLAPRRIKDVVELDGSVSPFQQVNLVARVAGALEEIRFQDGERVKAGQVLFVVEQPPYVAQLKLNQATLDKDRADYKRQSELLKQNANSQSNVESSLANLQQAEANVAIAQLNLDYTTVKAPFDGVVGRRQVDVGNYVGATQGGTVLATVMQLSPAYVYASIGERDALRLRERIAAAGGTALRGVGHTVVHALLQSDAPPGAAGVLDFIDHQVNSTTGTVSVRGRFDNADYHLVPGMYAKLVVEVGPERDALVLPSAILLSDQQGRFVFVVGQDGRAHRRDVVTSRRGGEEEEVLGGLEAGDKVVLKGADRLTDAQAVEVVDAGQAG